MKTETTLVKYTCDLCGKECMPIKKLILNYEEGFLAYGSAYHKNVVLDISTDITYSKTEGDVCESCLNEVLRRYMES